MPYRLHKHTLRSPAGPWTALLALAVLLLVGAAPAAADYDDYSEDGYGDTAGYEASYSYVRTLDGSATLVQGDTRDRDALQVNQPILVGDSVVSFDSAVRSENVSSPLFLKKCIFSSRSQLDVTMSKNPSLSKSSTIAPPAILFTFNCSDPAISRNGFTFTAESKMCVFESNPASSHARGTFVGYSPSVMYAMLRSQRYSMFSGYSFKSSS
jgi:hypothetical protein